MNAEFQAYRVFEESDGIFAGRLVTRSTADLPPGDLLVRVHWSALNYKDALSASGNRGITRNYPHTPGIDASGIVESSSDNRFNPGDEVIVTSYDLGMNTDGGFGQYIRVPAAWAVPLPEHLTLREAMILGTAGLTAAQSVDELIRGGVKPESGPVLVTGARGGVGSLSVSILAKLGYEVIAAVSEVTGNEETLTSLGARQVIDRNQTFDQSGRALLKSAWTGAIDTIGGNTLSTVIRATADNGVVVVVGNVESPELNINVFPFILRAIRVVGVGTQNTAMHYRRELWNRLATDWKPAHLNDMAREISLSGLDEHLRTQAAKKSRGRIILRLI